MVLLCFRDCRIPVLTSGIAMSSVLIHQNLGDEPDTPIVCYGYLDTCPIETTHHDSSQPSRHVRYLHKLIPGSPPCRRLSDIRASQCAGILYHFNQVLTILKILVSEKADIFSFKF